ncbi:F-box protein CPR1-like [Silene latifolia]|uniref:F-box protein CPR1-like n=1 Tax=Silene latifolia TaxID=37657 RepID=UPI003D76D36E
MSELRGLPDEILVEILSKLPIKTLILCASTCKCLLSFITTPSFIVSHIQRVGHNNPFIFLKYYTHGINKHYFSLHPDDDSFNGDFCLIDMPVTYDCHVNNGCLLNVVGSCNGVICLSNAPCKCHYSNNIFLWNPSIRKSILLPRANNVSTDVWIGLGFGFDSLTNDFKVVRLVYYKCPVTLNFKGPGIVEVYSLRSNSWRVVESFMPKYQIHELGFSQCFVRGALHWVGWSGSGKGVIVVFSVENELFGEIKMPLCSENGDSEHGVLMKVGKCGDKLALIRTISGSNIWSVWVMREYGKVESWTATCNLDFPDRYPKPMAFGFRKSEEVVVFVTDETFSDRDRMHLMLLVSRSGVVIKVLGMVDARSSSLYMDTYFESLALFTEGRPMFDNKFQGYNPLLLK